MKKRIFVLTMALLICLTILQGTAIAMGDISGVVSGGDWHTLAVKTDGTLWAWGSNFSGELGNGMSGGEEYMFDLEIDKDSPVKIMDDVISVSAGFNYTMAIKADGSLWAWGNNACGQLGTGSVSDIVSTPVKIMDNVLLVSTHTNHSAAVKNDGSLWVWGDNAYGQLGNGKQGGSGLYFDDGIDESRPIKVMDNASAVVVDLISTYAIKKDGSLWGWGGGNLGDGTSIVGQSNIKTTPSKITDKVKSICVGSSARYIIKSDNSLWGWGVNTLGQMGTGAASNETYSIPVKILDEVKSISADRHVLVVKIDDSLWTWGDMLWGHMSGDGIITPDECTPVKVMENVSIASAALGRSMVVKIDGSLLTWGTGYLGELGDGKHAIPMQQGGNNSHLNLTPTTIMEGVSTATHIIPVIDEPPSDWAVQEINAAIEAGLVPENIQKNYTQPVSRGNVAQMYINFIEKHSGQSIDEFLVQKGVSINADAFTDTNDKAVLAANALGIIQGVGNGRFEPEGTFTRAHVAAILNRIASVLGIDTAGYTHSFTDVAGHWVDAELGWPVHVGIIKGVGGNRFEPDTYLTTEQVIAATYRAFVAPEPPIVAPPPVNSEEELAAQLAQDMRDRLESYGSPIGYETTSFASDVRDSTSGGKTAICEMTMSNGEYALIMRYHTNTAWPTTVAMFYELRRATEPRDLIKRDNSGTAKVEEIFALLDEYST